MGARFPDFLACPLSLYHALNYWTRPETLPDRNSLRKKRGMCFNGLRSTSGSRETHAATLGMRLLLFAARRGLSVFVVLAENGTGIREDRIGLG